MSELGEYITSEYGVLKQIFSYLPSKSLASASQVCREWCKVAKRLLRSYNKPVSYCRESGTEWPPFNDRLQPKVIIHFTSCYRAKGLGADFFSKLLETYNLDNVSIYNVRNNYFIGSQYVDDKLKIKTKLGRNCEASLILCDMPGVTIKSFYTHSETASAEVESAVKDILKDEEIKCLLLISGGGQACIYLAHVVISMFFNLSNEYNKFPVVGGVAQKAVRNFPFSETTPFHHSCLCISFHGENVTTSSGLHELREDLDDFMEKLATDAGPLPEGAIRIGFIFSCINRLEIMRQDEIETFSKYFPDVPVYGLWSYGEFLTLNDDAHAKKKWLREECTSYLIVTLKKDIVKNT